MPAHRKKIIAKRSICYALLADDDKKIMYFRSHLKTLLKNASVKGENIVAGDCVTVEITDDESGASTNCDTCIARVQELRQDGSDSKIYFLLRWFYTGPSVLHRLPESTSRIANLSSYIFSPHELILSDHTQVFPVNQISSKVNVRSFNERIADQPSIDPGEWWYRYFWPTKQCMFLTAGHMELPQPQCAMGIKCLVKGYNPHSNIQHFCSRDCCQLWYHDACLLRCRFKVTSNDTVAPLVHMLHGTPGFECIELAEDGPDTKFFEQVKNSMRFIKGIAFCAQHAVMRGKHHGIVGNFNAVSRARALLAEARVSDLWPSDTEIKEFAKWKPPREMMYQCQKCGGAI